MTYSSAAVVVAGIDACRQRLPYALVGLDSDNGSEFINDHLKRYCEQRQILPPNGRVQPLCGAQRIN